MDDFPGNSQTRLGRPVRDDAPDQAQPDKKVTRVVEGEVIRRKRSMGKRFKELFVGDGRSVRDMVIEDILVPGLRDIVFDAFQTGVEGVLYRGDSRPNVRRPSQRGGGFNGHTRYDRMGSGSPIGRREDPRDRGRDMSRRGRANHDFDEVILPTRVEADEVLTQMFDLLERYDVVSVADLYQLVGVTAKYTDDKWGWTDLRGSGVTRTRGGGYLLDLPSPEPLKD